MYRAVCGGLRRAYRQHDQRTGDQRTDNGPFQHHHQPRLTTPRCDTLSQTVHRFRTQR